MTAMAGQTKCASFCAALALSAALATAAYAARAAETFGVPGPASDKAAKPDDIAPSERLHVDVGRAALFALEPVDNRTLALEDELGDAPGKMLRYGIGRAVALRALDGGWTGLADGSRLWVAEVVSPGALGLRLHFDAVALPDGAELAVYGAGEGDLANAGQAAEPAEVHRAFAGGAAEAGFWSGSMAGERARIEYLAPAGAEPTDELPFRVDQLQHFYRDPLADDLAGKSAGSCHNDVTCYPEWANAAGGVARFTFVSGGASYICSGQLLNDVNGDFTPYFLTASHCVDSSKEAGSAEFFWLYQTASCNGTPPSLATVKRSKVASLVSANATSDYSLLIVEGALPTGLFWEGWTSATVGTGTPGAAIHHPAGDFKRISFGQKGEGSCSADHIRVNWTDGPTEPGSSGSGFFRGDTGQLVGQLHYGPSACGIETYDCYGAFAASFPKVATALQGGSDDSSDQNDTCLTARTVPKGKLNDRIVKVNDEDWYKIVVPAGQTLTVRLDFTHANGDVDLAFFPSCAGAAFLTSAGTSNVEKIAVKNIGTQAATAWWRVYLHSDTRNKYKQTTSVN
jgi:hypothetical protein